MQEAGRELEIGGGRSSSCTAAATFVAERAARRRTITRSASIALACAFAALLVSGCETGRTNKNHAQWQHVSDDSTTGKPKSTQALGPGEHQPPVPGSPTAAGPDGNQPLDDSQALERHANEHGEAAAPHSPPENSPERK